MRLYNRTNKQLNNSRTKWVCCSEDHWKTEVGGGGLVGDMVDFRENPTDHKNTGSSNIIGQRILDHSPLLYTTSMLLCTDASSVEDAQDAARKPFFYSISIASVGEDSSETQGVINGSRDTQGLINGGQ